MNLFSVSFSATNRWCLKGSKTGAEIQSFPTGKAAVLLRFTRSCQ